MALTNRLPWQRSKRYGMIDVGTNSCLLLIVEVHPAAHEYRVLCDESDITQLGRGFYATQQLQEESMNRTLDAVGRFLERCDEFETDDVVVTGTSVLRDAENGDVFLDRVAQTFGVELEVISGEEEARLSYIAVRRDAELDLPEEASCIVADIGGGSTELIIGDERIRQMASLDVGAVRLTESFFRSDPPTESEMESVRAFIRETFQASLPTVPEGALVGVGGTITTLANIAAHEQHPVPPVHGFRLARTKVGEQIARFARMTTEQRKSIPGLEPKRAGVILAGAMITAYVLDCCQRDALQTSVHGLRYGVLFDRFLDDDEVWRRTEDR